MSKGDMFLKVVSVSRGPLMGEAQDAIHKDEIDVVRWSWGMSAQSALSSAGKSSKATLRELVIVKPVDSASTALMSMMRSNELVKQAILTVRKAGSTPHEYLKITIEKGRITSLDVNASDYDTKGYVTETLTLSFQKIDIEYLPQGGDGLSRGGMTFNAEIEPS